MKEEEEKTLEILNYFKMMKKTVTKTVVINFKE